MPGNRSADQPHIYSPISGLVNGDIPKRLDGTLILSTTADEESPVEPSHRASV